MVKLRRVESSRSSHNRDQIHQDPSRSQNQGQSLLPIRIKAMRQAGVQRTIMLTISRLRAGIEVLAPFANDYRILRGGNAFGRCSGCLIAKWGAMNLQCMVKRSSFRRTLTNGNKLFVWCKRVSG